MAGLATIPTWAELFGALETKAADAGRSLNSPAAYLADLLQILEDRFDPTDFNSRRPDISSTILLNGNQSFTLERQLDIVNSLLAERIASHQRPALDADKVLATAEQPFLLPFEYQHERIRQLLLLLRTSYRDLYSSFAPNPDVDILARERLNLSPARAATVAQEVSKDKAKLSAAYGLAQNEQMSNLANLDRFQQATQLDGPSLQTLLYSHLSQAPSAGTTKGSERDLAGQLFINSGLNGYVELDPTETTLIWSDASKPIPDEWFDRVHRLLCLSRWTGIHLTSLDLVLRQLCNNTLDLNALRRLAVLVDLRDRTQAHFDVLCALFAEIDGPAALGAGDDPLNPASLFDRVFNGAAGLLAKRYLRGRTDYLPQTYAGWQELTATGDVLLDLGDNKLLRGRIQAALGISATDLATVITQFRTRATDRGRVSQLFKLDGTSLLPHSLSILHRVTKLAELADLAPLDLLTLLEVLENDANLKVLNAFDVLYHEDISQSDFYLLLEEGSLSARSWLIQNILSVATWASAAGLEPSDLQGIIVAPAEATPTQETALVPAAQALHDAFLPTALSANLLQSDAIDARTAEIALAVFQQPEWGLVSPHDERLGIWEKHKARDAAYAVLAGLEVVSVKDLESLALGADLATYLQSLLVGCGVLDANGVLLEEKLPLSADDLVLETDGTAQFSQIFNFLNDSYTTALAGATQAAADASAAAADQTPDDSVDESDSTDDSVSDDSGSVAADDTDTSDDSSTATDTDTTDDSDTSDDTDTSDATDTSADGTGDDSSTDEDSSMDDSAAPVAAAPPADPSADIVLNLYPSDLLKLGFSVSDANEWIERLTFLRIIDSSGMVQNPAQFSDPTNLDTIPISVGINAFSGKIYKWLEDRRNKWHSATVTLPSGIWDQLPLSTAERDGLQQNLIFNHHIDATNRILDCQGLAALTPDTFDLALPFYRHRRRILSAMQDVVTAASQQYLTVAPADLQPLADQFAASDIHAALSDEYLDEQGRLTSELLADIDNEQPPFEIGAWYSSAQSLSVWNLLQQINSDDAKYKLTDTALATVDITGDDATDVVVALCAEGALQPDRSLTPEQVRRFKVLTSAQNFDIPQYADYSKDVFFLIHDVAVSVDAAVTALTTAFEAAVKAQDAAVIGALASQIQLAPDATTALVQPLLRYEGSPTVALMEPVLRAAVNDVLLEPPSDRMFVAAMARAQGFANFAAKVRMTTQQIEAAFRDQQLVDKFSEGIKLPAGVDGIDAIWAGPTGRPSGSSTFSIGDFANLASLVDKLAQPSRPIDIWFAAQLTPETLAAFENYQGPASDSGFLKKELLEDINRVLMGPPIYDTQRFAGVTLRPKLQRLLKLGLPGGDAPALNRLLIEDVYPQELAKNEVYLFRGAQYWTFDANTLELNQGPVALATLSTEFKGLPAVDAVYTLPTGEHWLLAQGNAWRRAADSELWVKATGLTARLWGRVPNLFDDPLDIDAVLLDREGRIHLFCGDQYVRYSKWPQEFVDDGYPKKIGDHWSEEIGFGPLPPGWDSDLDAGLSRSDEVTWLFKGNQFVASTDPQVTLNIVDFWGQVRNNLAEASRVDAVIDLEGRCAISAGDQISLFSNSLEGDSLSADERFPSTLANVFPNLPGIFAQGIDAGLTDDDGAIHLFRDLQCATRSSDGTSWQTVPITQNWGHVNNNLLQTGNVDAAFAGLDGKVYLFSGNQYMRYSRADLSRADEGYPKTISNDWGGLSSVDVAFVLDGKTYLFSSDDKNYVCYSTRDYTTPDDSFPKAIDENWWSLPDALVKANFHHPDAVFIAGNGRIHLFRGNQTIQFDHNHRWWTEPVPIHQAWPSLPFETVTAGFTGRDGKAYLFSNDKVPSFVRYTDKTFNRLDDRFPKPVKEHWGKLVNNIERNGRVDAAVAIVANVSETDKNGKVATKKVRYRYLFSGDQFYRYSSDGQQFVDEGYPLLIKDNLTREPYFAHLNAPAEQGIDGAWADSGNVYVFIADQMYVASFDHARQLDGLVLDGARAADVEDGRLTVFGKNGWRHILPVEAHTPGTSPDKLPAGYVHLLPEPEEAAVPRALRTAPPAFQGKLSAILRGLDRNVYLFGDTQCYDQALERSYPTGSAWGVVQNRIAEDERVDSALMGRDGKLYLFRGDQFISYTPTFDAPTKIPDLADTNPLPIAAHWGGLNNVCYAFVEDDVTYLLETPAADGTFRYVRYFGTDYSKPNDPTPLSADFSFWEIPQGTVNRGFDRVDAVFSDGDDFILIRDTEFIHYDAAADIWSVPRHLPLRWPGLVRHFPDFETIHAIVRGPDSQIYFFADSTWLSHDGDRPSALALISSRWALLQNRITQANRVDATLVCGDKTFLFSGDQYARYTGSDYEYCDAGYPRAIAGLLRKENAFQQLPDDVESAFLSLKPEDIWVAAAFCIGGVVVVSIAGRSYALSAQLSRRYPLEQVSNVRNELLSNEHVDAAFAREDGALFLLSGDQYVRYSQPDLEFVDDGYPRSIGDSLLSELSGKRAPLPLNFQEDIDAVLYDNGALVVFKKKQFVESDANGTTSAPKDIKGAWGQVSNPFLALNPDQQAKLDAAFVAPDNALYVFKGSQYLRYSDPTAAFVDEGYPREIRDLWGDLDDDFKKGIDGAFVFDGRTYLCRGKSFVRYSDPSYKRMDPTFPKLFTNRWRASNDFWLGDLRTIQSFVKLDQANPSDTGSLTNLLMPRPHDNADPYTLLATLFNWPVADVEWLKQRDAFLDRPSRDLADEVRFNIPQALRLYHTLQLCQRLGSNPQEMYEQVWTPLYANQDPTTAANTLERLLGTLYATDWTNIQRQFGDPLANALRDAQVGWLLAQDPKNLPDARALSDQLLTDVEVDGSVDTSPIVEATQAIQLYFYRYLTNLEPKAIGSGDDSIIRPDFKLQWQWLQNFQVWVANRKVFLYPESYIRPELRTTRTASFKTLQQNLQQGDITNDSVTQAYKQYLDDYTEVSRLIIAGGYVWQPDPAQANLSELTLFGFTRTDPRNYYFRAANFDDDSNAASAVWDAWQALSIAINSDRVYPVRAFGRTFVFWAEIEKVTPDNQQTATLKTSTSGNTQTVSGQAQVQYQVKVMYSFLDLSGQWTAPQTLDTGALESLPIQTPRLRVSDVTDANNQESITVDFTYNLDVTPVTATAYATVQVALEDIAQPVPTPVFANQVAVLEGQYLAPRNRAKQLTADLTVVDIDAVPFTDWRVGILDTLFAEPVTLTQDNVITIDMPGRQDAEPWYSFDIKGGSFLAKPSSQTATSTPSNVTLIPLAGNTDGLPQWNHVDAALDCSDGNRYLFNNAKMVYTVLGDPTEHPIDSRWGLRSTNLLVDGVVDAAWQRGGVAFLSRGGRYLTYSNGLDWADETGERDIATGGSQDGIPNWPSIDAAFTDKTGTTWFFHGTQYISIDENKKLGTAADIKLRWGHEPNAFTSPAKGDAVVVAAFARDDRTFLIGATSYTWYTGGDLSVCEPLKPQTLRAILDELKCVNSTEIDATSVVTAAMDGGTELLLKAKTATGSEIYSFTSADNKIAVAKRTPKNGPWQDVASFMQGEKRFAFSPVKTGFAVTVSGSDEQHAYTQDIRAALLFANTLYIFSVDSYIAVPSTNLTVASIGTAIDQWASHSVPIAERWGITPNAFTQGGPVTAAFLKSGQTFLVSGASYARYSGADYSVVDAGYPKLLTNNSDGLPQGAFTAGLQLPDGSFCFFMGTQYVTDKNLETPTPNQNRWGRIGSNILRRGVDTAYRIDNKHYLFSGDEIACYTAGGDGSVPAYMDQAPVAGPFGSFGILRGAFTYKGFFYLLSRDSFLCCTVDRPETLLPEYPRTGQAGALVADLRQRFNLPTNPIDINPTQYEVYALSLQGNILFLDIDDAGAGEVVLRLDLTSGRLTRDIPVTRIDWVTLRKDGSIFVDLPTVRYSFLGLNVMKTVNGVAAVWNNNSQARSIGSVWGGRPFDAALPLTNEQGSDLLYLFVQNQCAHLTQAAASDSGLGVVATNLSNALGSSLKPISAVLTNLPAAVLTGLDAILPVGDGFYVFKGNQYAHLTGENQPAVVPSIIYDIVRLTTSTAARLDRELFIGGLSALLSLPTQEVGDTPGFTATPTNVKPSPRMILVNGYAVNTTNLPLADHLDFASANGVYLWEIFYHAPLLIAGLLNTAQRFQDAKTWYEYVFDPTEPADAWKFLPFLTDDAERLVLEILDRLARLDQLKPNDPNVGAVRALSTPHLNDLIIMNSAFQGERELNQGEISKLSTLDDTLVTPVTGRLQALIAPNDNSVSPVAADLLELMNLAGDLGNRWADLKTQRAQIDIYLQDPFDPHAIAAQRPIAYRKATVMAYLNNLIAWGDMLFGQYTRETINQARMLYVMAWDVLGRRPQSLGMRVLPPDAVYKDIGQYQDGKAPRPHSYDMLMQLENTRQTQVVQLSFAASVLQTTPVEKQVPPYFFMPVNDQLDQYWTTVADRLYKIRHGLNLLGVKEALPLFSPPIDPMALVGAVAGGGLAGIADLSGGAVDVPHYRFTFLVAKAEGLAQGLQQLGSELLAALEKRDSEALTRLQTTQEGIILGLTEDMQKSQLLEAQTNLTSLQQAKLSAQTRRDAYQGYIDVGYLPEEQAQIDLAIAGVVLNTLSAVFNWISAPLSLLPAITFGLFSFGATEEEFEKTTQAAAMALQSTAGAVQGVGEILGMTAQHKRTVQDWQLQHDLAVIDMAQIDAQIAGAQYQIQSAQQQIAITAKQVEQNKAIADFYHSKFTNQELYEWMASRLSDLHYQTYQLTLDMARAAERAFQFERGQSEATTTYIQSDAWDSQRKGLLCGYTLGLALSRMESAFIATDAGRLQITKSISLIQMDPMAFIKLKTQNACEFDLTEALFDYDFPGHYCRLVKTIAVDLVLANGVLANATLTQVTSRTVMQPDPKAVSYLLSPKENPPQSIRTNWKAQQQIALSYHTQYETNSGVFELNFDADHYLPFEGTGAVSHWRLELGGPPNAYDLRTLTDVTITIKYTALQGGDAFAASVRGLLKPTDTLRGFNLNVDFADVWQAFIQGTDTTLQLPLTQSLFPNMVGGAIPAIFTIYEYVDQNAGGATFSLTMGGQQTPLPNGRSVDTSGLMVRAAGTTLNLTLKGDRTTLSNVYLLLGYKAGVR
jgi:hypothetical protein